MAPGAEGGWGGVHALLLVFRCFSLYPSSLSNSFLILLLTLSQILLYFINNLSSFIKKYIHLVLSKLFVYLLNFGSIIYSSLTYSSLFINSANKKIPKIFYSKDNIILQYIKKHFLYLIFFIRFFFIRIFSIRIFVNNILKHLFF